MKKWKHKKREPKEKRRFSILLRVFMGFFAFFVLLLMERIGILYENPYPVVELLDKEETTRNKVASGEATCLFIYDSGNETSYADYEEFQQILTDMRVSYDVEDLADMDEKLEQLDQYETIFYATTNLSALGEKVMDFMTYVEEGGAMLFALPLQKTTELTVIGPHIGIEESGYDYAMVDSFLADEDFMIGGGEVYAIDDGYESALNVGISDNCQVYATTGDGKVPLIWSKDYKEGRFVVCNFAYCSKAYRGVYASAYSLLEDVSVYPVINASTYYLDDFPSPVPQGDSQYIERDYGMDTAEFYSSVWWPDILQLGEEHDIQFTGLIIETYEDDTSGEVESNRSTADFYYYGNMLLNKGGEIGYHGYNHQPLCGPNYVYEEDLGYNLWESFEAMYKSIEELESFSASIFTDATFAVYVPPSNILSEDGRYMLGHDFTDIRCIASTYFEGNDAYSQEFEVAEDGVVETPRIISGGILDNYMRFSAFSELNFHYVNSHFMHPDDLLDEDRGAALGWEVLKSNLDEYMTWLDEAAPDIRHVTGSSMGGAVQRYAILSFEKEEQGNDLILTFDGLEDTAYCMVRINEGEIKDVTGGTLTNLTGNLYLLEVQEETVVISR